MYKALHKTVQCHTSLLKRSDDVGTPEETVKGLRVVKLDRVSSVTETLPKGRMSLNRAGQKQVIDVDCE